MELSSVFERVERIAATRHDPAAGRSDLEAALRDVTAVRSWLSAVEADVARQLRASVSCPEAAIADSTQGSSSEAGQTLARSATLDQAPDLASALDAGRITAGHVDAVTRAAGSLGDGQREELIARCDQLSEVAAAANVDEWRRRVRDEVRAVQRDDGMDRLERQRRATSLNTWVDKDGMWNLRGRFDPVTSVGVAARLDAAVEALFAEQTPETAPADPVARQAHLRALALARLVTDPPVAGRGGRAEYVVVIDTSGDPAHPPVSESPDWEVVWPIPVEIPDRVLRDLLEAHADDVQPVIVRNGIVLHAPGELNLGRSTRLANRAQRRALRGLYSTCAIPGCRVGYDRCKLHHVIWWRHGGRTDLDNLLPICTAHHAKVHHDGWIVTLGPDRRLRVELPDGTVMTTGPPSRRAA